MKRSRLAAGITAVAVFAGLGSALSVSAAENEDSGYELYEGESGLKTVVEVSSGEDLRAVSAMLGENEAYSDDKIFRLTNDIDLEGAQWEPVGYYVGGDGALKSVSFRGELDGNGHTISNFTVSGEYARAGLIASAENAYIHDLNISGASIEADDTAEDNDGTYRIECAGLICAFAENTDISDCAVSGTISVREAYSTTENVRTYVGMAAGIHNGGTVSRIETEGAIEAAGASGDVGILIGGVVGAFPNREHGFADNVSEGQGLVSNVSVTASAGAFHIGGIVGYMAQQHASLSDCLYGTAQDVAISAVEASYASVGGIAGVCDTKLYSSTVGSVSVNVQGVDRSLQIGGVCGYIDEAGSEIRNCASSARITAGTVAGESGTGYNILVGGVCGGCGMAGKANPVQLRASSFDGSIEITQREYIAMAGFICGLISTNAYVSECTVTNAALSVCPTGKTLYVGGIAGQNMGVIRRCVNRQDISLDIAAGNVYLGGITGQNGYQTFTTAEGEQITFGAKIYDSASEANLTAKAAKSLYFGGLVGYHMSAAICADGQPRIERCYAKGSITAEPGGTSIIGGAVGYTLDSQITDTYAECDVTAILTEETKSKTVFVSGFTRAKQNSTAVEEPISIIWNCYAAGSVSVSDIAEKTTWGLFASDLSNNNPKNDPGIVTVSPMLKDNYYLSDAPDADAAYAEPLTTEQFADRNSFVTAADGEEEASTWNFDDVWCIDGGRPRLQFEQPSVYEMDFDIENGKITAVNAIAVAKPRAGSKLYLASYSYGRMLETRGIEIENIATEDFAVIELDKAFEMPALGGEIKAFVWLPDSTEPLTDCETITE